VGWEAVPGGLKVGAGEVRAGDRRRETGDGRERSFPPSGGREPVRKADFTGDFHWPGRAVSREVHGSFTGFQEEQRYTECGARHLVAG